MSNQVIMIKPVSGSCNIDCSYCFYKDEMRNRAIENYGLMSLRTLEEIVMKALENADDFVTFTFQGGEPTLIGIEFFNSLIKFVAKYNKTQIKVHYAIQTNGLTIDDEWAKFFKTNDFLVGVSLDGPSEIHNSNRIDYNKHGTYKKVIEGIKTLQQYDVDLNILIVVSKLVARRVNKVYNYFKKMGLRHLQFIPAINPIIERRNSWELNTKEYAEFLMKLFDLWYNDLLSENRTYIRNFENIVGIFLGVPPESCDLRGVCNINSVIESDGMVYPCDFYVLDKYKLGRITDIEFCELSQTKIGTEFIEDSKRVLDDCNDCKYFMLCRNGCKRYRDDNGKYIYCSSMRKFYDYSIQRWYKIIQMNL